MISDKIQIIAVVGRTGAGKDTIVKELLKKFKLAFVCSYTDTPKRDDQVDGREHIFLTPDEFDKIMVDEHVVAYTKIVGRYCVTSELLKKLSVNGEPLIYIIDPNGISYFSEHSYEYDMKVLYVSVDKETQLERLQARGSIDYERLQQEEEQFFKFEESGAVSYCIDNNKDLESSINDAVHYLKTCNIPEK